MNTETETKKTHNTYILKSLLDVLSFSKLTLIGYLFGGIVVIFIERVYHILSTQNAQDGSVKELGTLVTSWFSGGIFPSLSLFVVWFIAGIATYLIFWLILVIFIDFYNNIVFSETFVHPKSFNKSNFWLVTILKYLLRACALLLILILIFVFIKFILPELFFKLDDAFSKPSVINTLYALLVPIVVVIFIHTCTVLLRVATMRRRLMYDGEPPV